MPRSFSVIILYYYDYYFKYACTYDTFIRVAPCRIVWPAEKLYVADSTVIIITCVTFESIIQSERRENFSTRRQQQQLHRTRMWLLIRTIYLMIWVCFSPHCTVAPLIGQATAQRAWRHTYTARTFTTETVKKPNALLLVSDFTM